MTPAPLHLLCIEPHFPGRLGAVADWLVRRRGYRCQFYCNSAAPQYFWPPSVGRGLDIVPFKVGGVAQERLAPWPRQLERALCYAYGCWEVLEARRPRPVDVILGRSNGLGSTLYAPVSFPAAPVVNLLDYYVHPHQHDLAGEAGPEMPAAYFHWRRASNVIDLLDLENGVSPWTLTRWQQELFPAEYRADFLVLYDGVDTRKFTRRPGAARILADRTLPTETKVVTFVASTLDRLRGVERFLELANRLLEARRDVVCIVVGDPMVQRGLDVQFGGQDYRAQLLARNPLHDPDRCWFLGSVPLDTVAELLARTDLHVYPSRPYPVSRALLEAMAAGAAILAWESDPVREFLTHGQTALLVKPGDLDAAVRHALAVLEDPAAHRPLGEAAAQQVRERYAQDVTLPALAEHFERLLEKRR